MGKKLSNRWSRFIPKGDLLNEINFQKGKIKERHSLDGYMNDKTMPNRERMEFYGGIIYTTAHPYCEKDYESMYIADRNVVDFIHNTKIDSNSIDVFRNAFKYSDKEYEAIMFYMKGYSKCLFVVKMFPRGKENDPMLNISDGEHTAFINISNLKKMMEYEDENDTYTANRIIKPMINLYLYMDAFPECVIDGPPPEDLPAMSKSDRSHIIETSDAIKEVYRNGVHPHMRRGHFRVLRSEVYKKKRYQTVYVRPTMVKGHASHIVEVAS